MVPVCTYILEFNIQEWKAAGRSGPGWSGALCWWIIDIISVHVPSLVCAVMMSCPLGSFAVFLVSVKNIFQIWRLNLKLLRAVYFVPRLGMIPKAEFSWHTSASPLESMGKSYREWWQNTSFLRYFRIWLHLFPSELFSLVLQSVWIFITIQKYLQQDRKEWWRSQLNQSGIWMPVESQHQIFQHTQLKIQHRERNVKINLFS